MNVYQNRIDYNMADNNPPLDLAIVVMASGYGSRFGSNKLLAEFKGRPLIHTIMDQIPKNYRNNTIVVTRYNEVKETLKDYSVKVVLHDYPRQRDTIRIGIEQAHSMEGCMFLTCDQPLRLKESMETLIHTFGRKPNNIIRLGYQGIEGNPVIFPKKYYGELMSLKDGEKGQTIIKLHREDVIIVEAKYGYELEDVDTVEDMERLSNTKC